MDTNCLVTKLKTTVNDFNLHYIDEVRVHSYAGSTENSARKIGLQVEDNSTIKTDGTHVFYYKDNSTPLTTYTTTQEDRNNGFFIITTNEDYDIIIRPRTEILLLNLSTHCGIEVDRVDYMSKIYNVAVGWKATGITKSLPSTISEYTCRNNKAGLDLHSIKDIPFTHFNHLDLQYSQSFGTLDDLVNIVVTNPFTRSIILEGLINVTGDLEDFASKVAQAGRTNTLTMYVGSSSITKPSNINNGCIITFDGERGYIINPKK